MCKHDQESEVGGSFFFRACFLGFTVASFLPTVLLCFVLSVTPCAYDPLGGDPCAFRGLKKPLPETHVRGWS